jgi:uncharacterized membrane protein YhaH (DUF805 family)
MPVQRKQFGRRGLPQQPAQGWADQTTRYGGAAASQAYPSPGYAAVSDDGGSGFSIFKAFGFLVGMLFSFEGRIGRMEYWTIGIVRFIIFILAIMAYASTLPPVQGEIDSVAVMRGFIDTTGGLLFLLLFLALTVCLFSLEVRRLHDRDASGLWVLLLFVPIIGGFYGLWLFIANGFFPGTPGTNRFDTAQSQASVFD